MPYPRAAQKRGGQSPASELQILTSSKLIFKTKPWLAPKDAHCRAITSQNSTKAVFKHVCKSWESADFELETQMCEAILARFSQIKELSHTRSFDNGYYKISASVSSHRIKTKTEDGRVSIIYQAKKTFSARLQHRSFIETHDLDEWEVRGYGELSGKILNPAILQEFHDRRDEANLLLQSAIDEANLALAQLLADIEPFKPAKRRKKSPERDPVKAL